MTPALYSGLRLSERRRYGVATSFCIGTRSQGLLAGPFTPTGGHPQKVGQARARKRDGHSQRVLHKALNWASPVYGWGVKG